ncbi:hypothetical protein HDZ31DRAFT_75363 [Schizophyllum fasciatum]
MFSVEIYTRLEGLRNQLAQLEAQINDIRPARYNQLVLTRVALVRVYDEVETLENSFSRMLPWFYANLPLGQRILFALAQIADLEEADRNGGIVYESFQYLGALQSLIPRWRQIVRQEAEVQVDGFATEGDPPFATHLERIAALGRREDIFEGLQIDELRTVAFGGVMPVFQRQNVEGRNLVTTVQLRELYERWFQEQMRPVPDPFDGYAADMLFDPPPPAYQPQTPPPPAPQQEQHTPTLAPRNTGNVQALRVQTLFDNQPTTPQTTQPIVANTSNCRTPLSPLTPLSSEEDAVSEASAKFTESCASSECSTEIGEDMEDVDDDDSDYCPDSDQTA